MIRDLGKTPGLARFSGHVSEMYQSGSGHRSPTGSGGAGLERLVRVMEGTTMTWKAIGQPVVRQQRGRWVVRVDGLDTETGTMRPRQLGTFPSQRAAQTAARTALVEGRSQIERGTVAWLVGRWVASRTDLSQKGREQYEWALPHITAGLGAVRLDQLDRDDVARWLQDMAGAGRLGRRSITICRTVLRAALNDGVDEGLLRRNPAARVPMPRDIAKPPKVRETDAWDAAQVTSFLTAVAPHRLAGPMQLAVLYGLRRSELLALRWDDIDFAAATVVIDEGLVATNTGAVWTDGKTTRSRRTIPVDRHTATLLQAHRKTQLTERLAAGVLWADQDLVVTTRHGRPLVPRNFNHTLERIITTAGLPRLTSHGLRHTAATHMVRNATDVGELRAIADVLGHSPDMLMRIYAHTLPESLRAVTDKIGHRAASGDVVVD
jgi:integrase